MSNSTALATGDFLFPTSSRSRFNIPMETFNLEEVEEIVVRNAMEKFGGNVSKVARELGLSRPALYRRLERFGLL
jgi:transcriptional regulator of acetoin/glycerol metabolism